MNALLSELLAGRPEDVPVTPFEALVGDVAMRVTAVLERTVVAHALGDPLYRMVIRITRVTVVDPSSLSWQPELGRRSTDSGQPDMGIRVKAAIGRKRQREWGDHRFRTERPCAKCGQTKPLSAFYEPKSGWCRECQRNQARENRDQHMRCRMCGRMRSRSEFPDGDGRKVCAMCQLRWTPKRERARRRRGAHNVAA